MVTGLLATVELQKSRFLEESLRTRTSGTAIIATFFLIPVGLLNAATFTFDFNSLARGLGTGSIQTYMTGILGAAGSVSVTDSPTGTTLTDKYYNADGHVVNGPNSTACHGQNSGSLNASGSACA